MNDPSLSTHQSDHVRALVRPPQVQKPSQSDVSPFQIYAGYEPEDITLLKSYCVHPAEVFADHYQDGFGVKTLFECVPFLDPTTLQLDRLQCPVPDDGFHAESIEYTSLVDALQRVERISRFCSVEIGAGWGPWMVASGVLARNMDFQEIKLIGVEADEGRFKLLHRHLDVNGLRPVDETRTDAKFDQVFTRLFQGAAWTHDGSVWFPKSEVTDMGSAAAEENVSTDYRGMRSDHVKVPCRTLETLLGELGVVDFMHVDVQGAELELLSDRSEWFDANVRACMVATHSRPIEGALVELLFSRGWELHREKPCRVDWGKLECELAGRTTVDGSQYWRNTRTLE